MTPSEIEPATFRLVDQRLNPLHHRVTHSPCYNSWFMIQVTIGEDLKICEDPEDMDCLLPSSEVRDCSIYFDVPWYHLTEINFAAFLKSQSSLYRKQIPSAARIFLKRSQNCEKGPLASSCLSVRPSVRLSVSMEQRNSQMDGFSWNLVLFENLSRKFNFH